MHNLFWHSTFSSTAGIVLLKVAFGINTLFIKIWYTSLLFAVRIHTTACYIRSSNYIYNVHIMLKLRQQEKTPTTPISMQFGKFVHLRFKQVSLNVDEIDGWEVVSPTPSVAEPLPSRYGAWGETGLSVEVLYTVWSPYGKSPPPPPVD